jgi:HAD superfamily hydrolase (TIGR01509 family)
MAARAVLFDLDGTVWDSHPWLASLAANGNARRQDQLLAALRNRRPAATLLRDARIGRSAFAAAARGPHRAALYPEVVATLDALTDNGTALGAVTNLPGWMANAMLAGLGLDDYFASVVTYERTRRRKPNPEPLLLALDELALRPSRNSWYVGDTAGDGEAAAAAGLSFAWASWGYAHAAPPQTDVHLHAFDGLLAL